MWNMSDIGQCCYPYRQVLCDIYVIYLNVLDREAGRGRELTIGTINEREQNGIWENEGKERKILKAI
jgi:hypothetical protein